MKLKELKSILSVEKLNIVVKNPLFGWNVLKYELCSVTKDKGCDYKCIDNKEQSKQKTLFEIYGEHEIKEIHQNKDNTIEIHLNNGLVL